MTAVQTTLSHEVGAYESALSRLSVEAVRTGRGYGPNVLRRTSLPRCQLFSGLVRFPVTGRTTIADDTIAVVVSVAAPSGSRWCGTDLSPGGVLLYGPGAEHAAVSPAGTEYRFAVIDGSAIEATAEVIGLRVRLPTQGSVTEVTPSARAVRSVLGRLAKNPLEPRALPPASGVGLLEATAHLLADPSLQLRERRSSRVGSRHLVNVCLGYADAVGGIPAISELCLAAGVSERRLRSAFHDSFEMAPNRYLRTRLLSRARERLIAPNAPPVTEVATDLGFDHLGRFSSQYRGVFGELPSDAGTAARRPSEATNRLATA